MSTEQPELSAFSDEQDLHEQVLAESEREFGASGEALMQSSEPERVCRNCGTDVPAKIARVVGDNTGCVPGCKHCRDDVIDDEHLDVASYTQTTRIVRELRNREHGMSMEPTAGGRR